MCDDTLRHHFKTNNCSNKEIKINISQLKRDLNDYSYRRQQGVEIINRITCMYVCMYVLVKLNSIFLLLSRQ